MSSTRFSAFAALLFSLVIFAAACNRSKSEDPQDAAEERNEAKFGTKAAEKDASFVVEAYSSSVGEARASEQAKVGAYTQEVKDLAATMEAAHLAMNTELQALAGTKNITLPADLSDKKKDEISKMASKTGRSYDEQYLDMMIADHKDAIRLFEKASSQAEDPAIKALFVSSLPELRHHLDMATALKDRMKDAKNDTKY